MKSISAAIVVLAGAATFTAGSFHSHSDSQTVVCGIGLIVGLVGLFAWAVTLLGRD